MTPRPLAAVAAVALLLDLADGVVLDPATVSLGLLHFSGDPALLGLFPGLARRIDPGLTALLHRRVPPGLLPGVETGRGGLRHGPHGGVRGELAGPQHDLLSLARRP